MSRKNFSKTHGRAVLPGQIWIRPDTLQPWRVMAVAEGYAMGRSKGGPVFSVAIKDMIGFRLQDQAIAGNSDE